VKETTKPTVKTYDNVYLPAIKRSKIKVTNVLLQINERKNKLTNRKDLGRST